MGLGATFLYSTDFAASTNQKAPVWTSFLFLHLCVDHPLIIIFDRRALTFNLGWKTAPSTSNNGKELR